MGKPVVSGNNFNQLSSEEEIVSFVEHSFFVCPQPHVCAIPATDVGKPYPAVPIFDHAMLMRHEFVIGKAEIGFFTADEDLGFAGTMN